MAVGSWGYYMQGNENTKQVEELGATLSKVLNCPVHYPAFGKRLFECKCGVLFPVFSVESAYSGREWGEITRHHQEGFRPDTQSF